MGKTWKEAAVICFEVEILELFNNAVSSAQAVYHRMAKEY
jgi:hypothetical protein